MAIILVIAGFITYGLSEAHATAAAAFIAINNSVLPGIAKWLMQNPHGGEHHHTNSAYQVHHGSVLATLEVDWASSKVP